MRIDSHTHFIPKEVLGQLGEMGPSIVSTEEKLFKLVVGPLKAGPLPAGAFDVDSRLKEMEAAGIDMQAVSVSHHLFLYKLDLPTAKRVTRIQNEAISKTVKSHPDRFVGNACLPLQDPQAAVEELEHSVSDLGLRGIEIGTNVAGKNIGSKEFFQVYEKAQDLDVPILIHPNDILAIERFDKFYSAISIGTLAETTIAATSIIFGGVLEAFPRLKFILCHGGGTLPYQIGRLDHTYQVRQEAKGGIAKKPSEFFASLYFDSVLFDKRALEFLLELATPEKVVLGTDYPFNMGNPESPALVDSLDRISGADREKIKSENCRRLYHI